MVALHVDAINQAIEGSAGARPAPRVLGQAVIVGHDWAGHHLWRFGLRHPGRCAKLVGLNTPYAPRGPVPPTQALRERFGENGYYMLWHQTAGRSEAELEADLRGNPRARGRVAALAALIVLSSSHRTTAATCPPLYHAVTEPRRELVRLGLGTGCRGPRGEGGPPRPDPIAL